MLVVRYLGITCPIRIDRVCVFVLQVPGGEEEVHHRAEGVEAEGAESLRASEHHQPHHGHEVLPGQNVPRGGL